MTQFFSHHDPMSNHNLAEGSHFWPGVGSPYFLPYLIHLLLTPYFNGVCFFYAEIPILWVSPSKGIIPILDQNATLL